MNQQERDQLGKFLTKIAFLYGHELSRERISMWIETAIEFIPASFGKYMSALQAYTQDQKNNRFPTPGQIKPYINPELSIDSTANEIASRIQSAVVKFGYVSPKKAQDYIGSVGWMIVERSGGWESLCQRLGVDISIQTYFAQSRDLAKSLLEQNKLGVLNQPIMLENKNKDQIENLNKVQNLISSMSQKSG